MIKAGVDLSRGTIGGTEAGETILCRAVLTDGRVCAKPMLPDFPHHHETAPRPEWNPMPARPADPLDMIAFIRAEIRAEVPVRLHVAYVPSQAEPIGVSEYSLGAAGYVPGEQLETVLDTGALGSPSWAPAFHRYIGAITGLAGELVLRDEDLAPFPWLRQLEGLRRWCAGDHRTWYEHQQRPLCWTLVRHVVFGGYGVGRAGELEGISPETADRLLISGAHGQDCEIRHRSRCPDGAFGKWWAWVSNDVNAIDLRARRSPAA